MIIWDEEKNNWLKLIRNISFEEVADKILNNEYLDILENPSRPEQSLFVVEINNYIHAVPFILDDELNLVLKTIYPSRKLNKLYRG